MLLAIQHQQNDEWLNSLQCVPRNAHQTKLVVVASWLYAHVHMCARFQYHVPFTNHTQYRAREHNNRVHIIIKLYASA